MSFKMFSTAQDKTSKGTKSKDVPPTAKQESQADKPATETASPASKE